MKHDPEGVSCLFIFDKQSMFLTSGSNQTIKIYDLKVLLSRLYISISLFLLTILQDGSFIKKIPTLSPISCMTVSDTGTLYGGLAEATIQAWDIEVNHSYQY
jgi:hypothetical protein